jgi:hypothetical protein
MGNSVVPPRLSAIAEAAQIQDSEAPARAAALKAAEAEAAQDRLAIPSSAAVIARVRAEEGVRPVSIRSSRAARARSGASRARKARPAARARTEPRRETEFLERQGYIY